MDVQAKLRVTRKSELENGAVGGVQPGAVEVTLQPVYAEDGPNKSWSKWTPSGECRLTITNPDAFKQFELGKEYLVTFSPCEG